METNYKIMSNVALMSREQENLAPIIKPSLPPKLNYHLKP
jgi:hypothetical protein